MAFGVGDNEEDANAILTSLDYEEQNAGYQAAFSKLAASQPIKVDPVAHVTNSQAFMKEEVERLVRSDTTGTVKGLMGQVPPAIRNLFN